MTIDERLQALVERHEALAQDVELMHAEGSQRLKQLEELLFRHGALLEEQNCRSAERLTRIEKLAERNTLDIAELRQSVAELREGTGELRQGIAELAETARSHERRLQRLEA